jgi:hypothetical protein
MSTRTAGFDRKLALIPVVIAERIPTAFLALLIEIISLMRMQHGPVSGQRPS